MKIKTVNLKNQLNTFSEYWNPKIVGELNQQFVKIAKLKGDFVMHKHDDEDELFYVIKGVLYIEMKEETLEIKEGEFVIIPKGVAHRPYAPEEVHIMLFEPTTTLNTGDQVNEMTVKNLERI